MEEKPRRSRQARSARVGPMVVAIMMSLVVFGGASVAVSVLIADDFAMDLVSDVLSVLTIRITQGIAERVWQKANRKERVCFPVDWPQERTIILIDEKKPPSEGDGGL